MLHLLDLDFCANPRGNIGDDGDERGQKLWQLNAEAVAFRYREPVEVPGAFAWSPRNYTAFQMLKAAWCWMYQCSEGDQFTGSLLFAEVERKARLVSNHIVSNLPQYDAADWDAPHNPRCEKPATA